MRLRKSISLNTSDVTVSGRVSLLLKHESFLNDHRVGVREKPEGVAGRFEEGRMVHFEVERCLAAVLGDEGERRDRFAVLDEEKHVGQVDRFKVEGQGCLIYQMAEKHVKRFAETEETHLCCEHTCDMSHQLN